jgi:hypothetical protein
MDGWMDRRAGLESGRLVAIWKKPPPVLDFLDFFEIVMIRRLYE